MVVWVTPPPVPVTVIVRVPGVALLATLSLMVDDPVPGAGMGFGLKLTVTRLPCPEADNEIAELNPFKAVVLIVEEPELPRLTVTEEGDELIVKSAGLDEVTVSETVVVCVIPPPTPVTVMVYVPGVTLAATAIVITELPVPGAGMGLTLKVTVTPLGSPEADNVIALLKPFNAVVLMVEVPLFPCCTVTDCGDAPMLKSGVVPQFGNLKFTIRVLQLKEPVVTMYSCVYQNVQSSTGSTCMAL